MNRNLEMKFARHTASLSQSELADKAGVSYTRVQRIESGRAIATIDEMRKISAALGIDARRIFAVPHGWRTENNIDLPAFTSASSMEPES